MNYSDDTPIPREGLPTDTPAMRTAWQYLQRLTGDGSECATCCGDDGDEHEPTDPCGIVANLLHEARLLQAQSPATAPAPEAVPDDGFHAGDDALLDAITAGLVALEEVEAYDYGDAIKSALEALRQADALRVAELRPQRQAAPEAAPPESYSDVKLLADRLARLIPLVGRAMQDATKADQWIGLELGAIDLRDAVSVLRAHPSVAHRLHRERLLLDAQAKLAAAEQRAAELRAECHELAAVCICGCPDSDHENYGEDGEACEDEWHECFRTSKAAYAVVHRLREQLAAAAELVEEVKARVGNRVPSAWSEFGDGHDYSRTGKHDSLVCRFCLRAQLTALTREWEALRAKYYELLYGVESKHPNETRHETALRYIRQAARGSNQAQARQTAPAPTEDQ